jgi:hypothetical protein
MYPASQRQTVSRQFAEHRTHYELVNIEREELCVDPKVTFQPESTELDTSIATVLLHLWTASHDPTSRSWSLAKLGKRSKIAMSTLLRNLAPLEEAGLVEVSIEGDGREVASLSASGLEVCAALFAAED